jgi:hypothetical protein
MLTHSGIAGKLHLVDLAGCERIEKSGATGETMKASATSLHLALLRLHFKSNPTLLISALRLVCSQSDCQCSPFHRPQEALAINSSLSALGDVVAALVTKAKHVPYRCCL